MADDKAPYRALLEAAPDAIVAVDTDGQIVFVNTQTEALFGYSSDELVGELVEVLVPASARAVHVGNREGYMAHPVTRPMGVGTALAGRRKDGTEFPAEISLSAIDTDDGLLVSAAIRDGGERRLLAIIASSSDAITSMRLDGTILTWNPAAERVFGLSARDAIGRNIADVVGRDGLGGLDAHLGRVRQGEPVGEYDTDYTRSGTTLEFACSWSPMLDHDAHVIGASLNCRDITERKRAAAQRTALEERLNQSQRLEALGQLAGGIAHDFNNLLAVILNYASFVAEATEGNPAAQADVEQIRAAAERAARLVQQLMIFGRQESVQIDVIDVNALITSIREMLSRTFGERIELAVRLDPDLLAIRADRGRVEQVLVNLAVNARDAMPDGGELTIATKTVEFDAEYATLHPGAHAGTYVQISVSDTGAGMSTEVLAHAIEPFFTTKPKGFGTGLGLATVYGIVAEAGGTLSLYSEEGLGTVVSVFLPATEEPATTWSSGRERTGPSGDGEVIVVVEDEEALRQVTARVLRRNGYVALEAATPEEAFVLADEHEIHLLLTDVVMPHLSGPELADRMRRERPELPVLFMSGYSQGVLGPHHAVEEDFRLIQMPFNEKILLSNVQAALTEPS